MPRQAHGRPVQASAPSKIRKRKQKSAALNALEIAEKEIPDAVKVRQSRLGQIEDDSDEPVTRADVDERSGKRRKITDTRNGMDDDNLRDGSGSDDEGGRWHEGVEGSDEDSDIDSDEAFGESDEERFADFTFRGSNAIQQKVRKPKQSAKKSVSKPLDLDEDDDGNEWQDASAFNDDHSDGSDEDGEGQYTDEEQEEDDDDDLGEDAVDLATALDMNLEEERKEAERLARKKGTQTSRRSDTRARSSDIEDAHDDDDDDDNESQFSISDDGQQGDFKSLQQFIASITPQQVAERTTENSAPRALSDKPSTFGLGALNLSAADLMQYIKDPTQRQSLKLLQSSERNGPDDQKGGIPGKLSAPLAKRQQDRLDRAAAYDKSKETLNRWIETVKQNRRAEHLSFPLFDNAENSAKSARQLTSTILSAPANELEAAIQAIMQESGVGGRKDQDLEDQEATFEELAEKQIPLEEVRARRAQLRMARELMFREEIRAKRIKKIKSKAYRRVHRKERDRIETQQREGLAAAGLLDSDEEREKNDRRRAEERMGARHRESKWAKSVQQTGRAAWDDDARLGVADLSRRDEELRRRIEGRNADGSDSSDDESESEAADTDTENQRWDQQLSRLAAAEKAPQSKLGSMAFMQRAEAGRRAENDEELRQLRIAMGGEHSVALAEDSSTEQTGGRQRYGNHHSTKPITPPSGKNIVRNEFEAPLSDDESPEPDQTMQARGRANAVPDEKALRTGQPEVARSAKTSVQTSHAIAGGEPIRLQRSVASRAPPKSVVQTSNGDYTSPSESEDEAQTPSASSDAEAELAAAIFAGSDDAVREFEKEKKQTVDEEGDQVIDNTLPGWGSWTGVGVSKREQKNGQGRLLTTIPGVDPKQRKDAKLDRVIINERRIKKNGKYLATELPHPYENRQQYERSLRLPMGPEWSTAKHFQGAIKPRILLKQGTVIKPMSKPSA